MRKLAFSTLALIIFINGQAQQDKHFSMFYASPMAINPGATGFFPGDIQVFSGFKNQWKSISSNPYNTISASADAKLIKGKSNNSFLGLGVNFYNDKSGDSHLTTNITNISINYAIEVADNHQIALGFQPSFFQRFASMESLTWDQQWTGSTFDSNLDNGETLITDKSFQFDINSGLYYFGKFNNQNSINFGVSVAHLSKPKNTLLNGNENLYQRYTIHGGGEFSKNGSKIAFSPNMIYFKQGPNQAFSVGTDFIYSLKESSKYTGYYDKSTISLGTYIRIGDAFYTTLFLNFSEFSLGVSYDLNMSGLSVATNGRGGMELLLRYRIKLSKSRAASL
jgi:type IX secretion system PorP/SprF family membrane protein